MKFSNHLNGKIHLAIITVLTFSFIGFSQQRDSGTIEIVPYLGYTSSFLNGSNIEDLGTRGSLRFGLIGDFYFNDRWSIRSGLCYDSLGANSFFLGEYQFDYLNIPINANWHFGSTRKWNLNFGATPGFLLKSTYQGLDIKENIEKFHLAITYGIGYRIELSQNIGVLVDWQGLVGITQIPKTSESTWLNAAGSFNAGLVFAL